MKHKNRKKKNQNKGIKKEIKMKKKKIEAICN